MKKQIFLLVAAMGTASAYAEGRGVNAYGTADASLFFQSRVAGANPAENQGRTSSLHSAGIAPSVLGFRGSEDLGRGYSAGFNLETHIDISNGSGNALGPLWARAANVSVAGPYEYALLKRTVLYAQAARIDAGANADAAVSILGAQPVQGRTTVVSNIGLRHSL